MTERPLMTSSNAAPNFPAWWSTWSFAILRERRKFSLRAVAPDRRELANQKAETMEQLPKTQVLQLIVQYVGLWWLTVKVSCRNTDSRNWQAPWL